MNHKNRATGKTFRRLMKSAYIASAGYNVVFLCDSSVVCDIMTDRLFSICSSYCPTMLEKRKNEVVFPNGSRVMFRIPENSEKYVGLRFCLVSDLHDYNKKIVDFLSRIYPCIIRYDIST